MQAQASAAARKIIRKSAVKEQTGLSDTTIWREEKAGRFPMRVQITANSVGWFQDEITAWVHERIRGSRSPSPNPRAARHNETPTPQSPPGRTTWRPQSTTRSRLQ